MKHNDEEKKKKILQYLKEKPEEWRSMNQIQNKLKYHSYKIETLMYQLFYSGKVENQVMGKFTFWRFKK